MKVWIVGAGMGNPSLLTLEAKQVIENSDLLISGQRMLQAFEKLETEKAAASDPHKIAAILRAREGTVNQAAVLVSGDTGFYSAAKSLPSLLDGIEVQFCCGVSSLQYFCAKLGASWDDAAIISLHGREQDLLNAVYGHKKIFVLTGGVHSAKNICAFLTENGYGHLRVAVGEDLSYVSESITLGDAESFSRRDFSPLCVMMIFNPSPEVFPATHGLPDSCFVRGAVPMTKAEVRAVVLAKLELKQNQTLWDVGAGTGSVSVEAARVLREGKVYAVEQDPEALDLLRQNREELRVHNLYIASGTAPEVLSSLPVPDAVFIGGSSGKLVEIIDNVLTRNPKARIVLNAVTLETLTAALSAFEEYRLPDRDVVQVSVTKTRLAGNVHLLSAQNPVFILSAGGLHG